MAPAKSLSSARASAKLVDNGRRLSPRDECRARAVDLGVPLLCEQEVDPHPVGVVEVGNNFDRRVAGCESFGFAMIQCEKPRSFGIIARQLAAGRQFEFDRLLKVSQGTRPLCYCRVFAR